MNSALNIIKIILLSFIAVALTIVLIVLLNGKIKINGIDLYEKTELVYENTFTEPVENLNIITTNNDVKCPRVNLVLSNIICPIKHTNPQNKKE